ncbi:DUF3310 domain-containing protein [Herbaspirillum sp.]|jgi:hypothetical protein|uniref:DUF3310 domain-containing protein n=1 Tax=Herbaspirillum sp. TaxID=1890675 RepID=UPI00257A0A9F|nr:DUF3310 domain-containing protein [Herbaspirillum sp.]|tara:strand:- start:34350 stop:35159 length:810 start_codon:yes stop_codon:yes gene_type:complete
MNQNDKDQALTKCAMQVEPALWGYDKIKAFCGVIIQWDDYQQRRTELINEPDDAEAPEWARWKAQDGDGEWYWHEAQPHSDEHTWDMYCPNDENQMIASYGKIPAGHDWRKTLKPVNQYMSNNEPVKSRNEPHGITGVKHRVDRQLNPNTSSLTDSQAREYAEELKTCSDGQPCGQEDYCDDCPNAPHAQDARRLDEQLRDAINPGHYRQGGIECIDALKAATVGKTGIEAVCVANVIKYLWRYEEKNGVEDVEKALWYLNRLHDELHD